MIVLPDDTGDPQALIASLRAERDAALAGQAALAEVMELINRSPGDPTPVFDAVLDKAMQLSGAAFGILMIFDGRRFATVAASSLPPAFANFARAEISLETEHPQSALDRPEFKSDCGLFC